MSESAQQPVEGVGSARRRKSGYRIECAVALFVIAGILLATAMLTPSATGVGTHEKVFMLPCGFRWLTTLPCPLCGLTTALAHMARGDVLAAFDAHVLGPVAYLLVWLLGLRAVYGVVRGLPLISERMNNMLTPRVVFGAAIVGWVINVARFLVR